MNLLHLIEPDVTPPDKLRWKCPRTGHVITAMSRQDWFPAIEKFNRDNGFDLPDNWRKQAEHDLCMLLPPGFCKYSDGSAPTHHLNTRSSAETIMAGTRVFLEFVKKGMPVVAPEVAEARARTCAACYASVPVPGCGGCVGLVNLVMEVVGSGETSADDQLQTKSCAWCGCSALANVWMPAEISKEGVTDAMLDPGASPPWCWKASEIRALRNP